MLTFLIRQFLKAWETSSRVCMPNLEVFGPIMKEEEWNTQDFGKVKLIYRLTKFETKHIFQWQLTLI
jgi:hypothetical protein